MMSEIRKYGKLIFPNESNKEIDGVWLTIKDSSVYLETPYHSINNDTSWEIVLGVFNGLDKVTFIRCYTGGGSSGMGGTWRRIWVSFMLKRIHIPIFSELNFKRIALTSPTLSDWIIVNDRIKSSDGHNFSVPENVEVLNVESGEITISVKISYGKEYGSKLLSVEKGCVVKITSKKEINIDEYSELITKIKKLILFLTNKNPEFSHYHLSNSDDESYELVNTIKNLADDRFSQNIRLSYNSIKNQLPNLMKNWMNHEKLIVVVDLLLEKCYNTELSFQGYFLNMCVAIESFHDRFSSKKKYKSVNEKLQKRDSITKLIEDEDLKRWFRKESTYWKKPTLKDRLLDFTATIEGVMGNTFQYDLKSFLQKTVKTRNDIAHKGEYDNYLTHFELFLVGKVLEFTLRIKILDHLGFISEKPIDLVQDARRNIEILARMNNYNPK